MGICSAAANAETTTIHVRDKGAFAFFVSTDGNIQTITTIITTSTRVNESGPGGPTTTPLTSVSLFQQNTATNEVLLAAIGSTTDHSLTVSNDLSTATLQTTLTMFDLVSDTSFTSSVNLSWASTGEPVTEHSVIRFSQPGFRLVSVFKGTQQEAVATGTVTAFGMNFTPIPSDTAQIQENKTNSFITIEQ